MDEFSERILKSNPAWPEVWRDANGLTVELLGAECTCTHPESPWQSPCSYCRAADRVRNDNPPRFFVSAKQSPFTDPVTVEAQFVRWEYDGCARVVSDEFLTYGYGFHGGEFRSFNKVVRPYQVSILIDGVMYHPVVSPEGVQVEELPVWMFAEVEA